MYRPRCQHWFQSLFSWNLLLMMSMPRLAPILSRVSILVFVELALDVPERRDQEARKHKFQSLFSWNLLLMFLSFSLYRRCSMFQSLFSWNLLLMSMGMCYRGRYVRFQSLFSWNLLLMFGTIGTFLIRIQVSILVFVELALDVLELYNISSFLV